MPELLLVGAGHAHLHLIAHAADLVAAGYRVRVLAPPSFDYSGVASATAAGSLPASTGRIDIRALCALQPVDLVEATLVDLDVPGQVATTSTGETLSYDVLSFNVGSVVDTRDLPVDDQVLRVKPLSDLAELSARLEAVPGATVTVIGGGSTGLELATHLSVRPGVARVRLVEAGPTIGADLPAGARRRLVRLLARRGVEVLTNTSVREITGREVLLDSGPLPHDVALLATGLAAPPLLQRVGVGGTHGVPVTATLQHVDHPEIYAGGDCAHFTPQPLPRVGVHGVRQGPVLLASLLARAGGDPLPTYTPPARSLSVLDLGGGVGLAVRGRWWWYGAAALRLKERIDIRWLDKYRSAGTP
ncbi:NAD(P)/FAD-dependent oxidoreductase [Nocardioides sp.]|uniref:NAD(P)/FAD-dependent oxidoreductase n=1 Tax=Nocardioides sp. TaxID=35761 RepID=UPI002B27605C|nr:FAD-dependent oxidoreductase [Nocardioides sp.]